MMDQAVAGSPPLVHVNSCYVGDVMTGLRAIANSGIKAQCCVTSPPYYGLRAYLPENHPLKYGEIGTEKTPNAYICKLVQVFSAVREVLTDYGVLWVNIGDSYAANRSASKRIIDIQSKQITNPHADVGRSTVPCGMRAKSLMMIPHRLAIALADDGWIVRDEVVWAKLNPMVGSQKDRCTRAHEYVFMLTKQPKYYHNYEAIREPAIGKNHHDVTGSGYVAPGQTQQKGNRRNKFVLRKCDT